MVTSCKSTPTRGNTCADAEAMCTGWPSRDDSCCSICARTRSPPSARCATRYAPAASTARIATATISALRMTSGRDRERMEVDVERTQALEVRPEPREVAAVVLPVFRRPDHLGERRQARERHVLDGFGVGHVLRPHLRL